MQFKTLKLIVRLKLRFPLVNKVKLRSSKLNNFHGAAATTKGEWRCMWSTKKNSLNTIFLSLFVRI